MIKLNFKTKSPYFEKERDGLKCCTVREVWENDSRFDDLMLIIQTKEESEIDIRNPETGEAFARKITDITYYNERFIISWKHEEKKEK